MTIGRVKPIEARFVGNGNLWVDGRFRGWQVTCSTCPATKTLSSHGGNSLPPRAIIKKLRQAGWVIGNKPKDDLCPECQRKPVMTHIGQAKKALTQIAAPMVSPSMHFSMMAEMVSKLAPETRKQLIKTLRETLPKPEPKPKKEKVQAAPVESDAEYAQWLDELK